jgi:hypothetical protein
VSAHGGVETTANPKPGSPGYLKWYWTKSPEGRAKWVNSPHPWTTLHDHLVKHIGPEMAKRVAASWFKAVFGYWPGSRKGSNPVGPG